MPLAMLIPGAGAMLVYGVARLAGRHNGVLAGLTAALHAASLCVVLLLNAAALSGEALSWAPSASDSPVFSADAAATLMAMISLSLGFFVALYSGRYLALDRRYEDYYPLLLLLSSGLVGLFMAVDLFVLYLLGVLTSAACYVLVSFRRGTETAIEAGFKYVITGSMASMAVLAGIGFMYRTTGSLLLPVSEIVPDLWYAFGLGLVLFGYAVKAALFPAHTWLPDAHGRAPSSISAMLSGVVVQAYLFVMVRVALGAGLPARSLGWLLLICAIPGTFVGNLMALRQIYGKRLLGYSSVAQVGYVMAALGIGFVHEAVAPISAGMFLLASHAAMKGLAFLCKGIFHFYCGATLVEQLDGMSTRLPWATAGFVLALAGLAGVAPLAGFRAKLQTLVSAIRIGGAGVGVVVALIVVNSLLSMAYYVPLIGRVLKRSEAEPTIRVSPWMLIPVLSLGALVIVLGLLPGPLLHLTDRAAVAMLSWSRGP